MGIILKRKAALWAGLSATLLLGLTAVASLALAGQDRPHRPLAELTKGDLSERGLMRLSATMDAGMLKVAERFAGVSGASTFRSDGGWRSGAGALSGGGSLQPALHFQAVTPQDAERWNLAVPISLEPNPAAKPFTLSAGIGVFDEARALDCLTVAVYYEAGFESVEGRQAVAQVVLNRMRHPAYPKTVCGVVFQGAERQTGCQFTFTCDGALNTAPDPAAWARARETAKAALNGYVYKPVGHATHYHTVWVVPYWAPSLTKVAHVGAHVFYRWQGGWGLPQAFGYGHAGNEPDVVSQFGVGAAPFQAEAMLQLASLPTLADLPPLTAVTVRPTSGDGASHTAVEAQASVVEEPAFEPEPTITLEAEPVAEVAAMTRAYEAPAAGLPEPKKRSRLPVGSGW